MTRPSWDEYFMSIAFAVAERSTCIRPSGNCTISPHKGAIIVADKHIISTGYNGVPAGRPHCEEVGCARATFPPGEGLEFCRAVHAEQNALVQAAKYGTRVFLGRIYCTHSPCFECAKLIVNAGLWTVIYKYHYPDERALDLLRAANIEARQIVE